MLFITLKASYHATPVKKWNCLLSQFWHDNINVQPIAISSSSGITLGAGAHSTICHYTVMSVMAVARSSLSIPESLYRTSGIVSSLYWTGPLGLHSHRDCINSPAAQWQWPANLSLRVGSFCERGGDQTQHLRIMSIGLAVHDTVPPLFTDKDVPVIDLGSLSHRKLACP